LNESDSRHIPQSTTTIITFAKTVEENGMELLSIITQLQSITQQLASSQSPALITELQSITTQLQAQIPAPTPAPVLQIGSGIVRADAGTAVVHAGLPMFVHTLNLPTPDNSPVEQNDFDWDMGLTARFSKSRGRTAAMIYPAGSYTVTCTVTNSVTKHAKTYTLKVTSVDTRRQSFTASTEAGLRTCAAMDDTDVTLTADMTIGTTIVLGNRVRIVGQNHKLTAKSAITMFSQPHGKDACVIDGLQIDGKPDVTFSPAGTRFAIRNIAFIKANVGVNANGKPQGLLVEDCYTTGFGGVEKYTVWNDSTFGVIRGVWVDDSIYEHCIRGEPICNAYDRCHFVNGDHSAELKVTDMQKGTITAHSPADLSIDLCSCGRDGAGSRGGDVGFGPLGEADAPAQRISMTRSFVFGGAVIIGRAGTLTTRVQDCATSFKGWDCFVTDGSNLKTQPKPQVSYVYCGVGSDPTPTWTNKRVTA
jgi:PKD repeat protein